MPNRRGPNTYKGYESPNTHGWPKPIREEVKHVYGAWREEHPGEDPAIKAKGSRIAWNAAKEKYPELYEQHVKSHDPPSHKRLYTRQQVARGTRMELKEHPQVGRKGARQIAIQHLEEDPTEYSGRKDPNLTIIHTPNLKIPHVKPAKTRAGRKKQIRDLRQAAQEQRRWAKEADNEGKTESKRGRDFKKHGMPIRGKVLSEDAILAKRFGTDRRKVAHDLDLQAERIAAVENGDA